MNTTENKSRAPKKAKWNRPVTKAFYEKLRLKAVYVVREVHEVPGYVDIIMDFIDRYMFYQQKPFYYTESMWIWSFFAAIQGDIDKAIERRKRAKERAAERKAARERAKAEAEAQVESEAEAMKDTAQRPIANEASTKEASSETVMGNTGGNATEAPLATEGKTTHTTARSKITRLCESLFSGRHRRSPLEDDC